MLKKQIVIIAFALITLVGGIYIVARNISNKSQEETKINSSASSIYSKKDSPKSFIQEVKEEKADSTVDASGSIEMIEEKTLTIKQLRGSLVVNINGATPVMLIAGRSQPVPAQVADLKKGELVKITYDKTTKNAIQISIIRPQK